MIILVLWSVRLHLSFYFYFCSCVPSSCPHSKFKFFFFFFLFPRDDLSAAGSCSWYIRSGEGEEDRWSRKLGGTYVRRLCFGVRENGGCGTRETSAVSQWRQDVFRRLSAARYLVLFAWRSSLDRIWRTVFCAWLDSGRNASDNGILPVCKSVSFVITCYCTIVALNQSSAKFRDSGLNVNFGFFFFFFIFFRFSFLFPFVAETPRSKFGFTLSTLGTMSGKSMFT